MARGLDPDEAQWQALLQAPGAGRWRAPQQARQEQARQEVAVVVGHLN